MRFQVVFIINPFDYLAGIESCETIEFEFNQEPNDEVFADILFEVSDGYNAVIMRAGDEPRGRTNDMD